jgi:hypothetical protein
MKYCYSTDGGEVYSQQFDDAGAAAGAAECEIDGDGIHDDGTEVEYWVGEAVPAIDMLDCDGSLTGERILEDLEARCADEIGWDDIILALSAEHQARLGRFVLAYVKRHNTNSVYGVRNAVKHVYVVGSNDADRR